jgi:hypothetical protein
MDSRSVAAWKASGLLGAGDRFLNNMDVEDDDIIVVLFFGDEAIELLFRRVGSSLEMAGFWG